MYRLRKMLQYILIVSSMLIGESLTACDGICVKKCCGDKEYVSANMSCETNAEKFDIAALKVYDVELVERGRASEFFSLEYGAFEDELFRDNAFSSTIFYQSTFLLQNGSILAKIGNITEADLYDNNNYCIDYFNKTLSNSIFVWFLQPSEENNVPVIFIVSMIISCVFLVLVLVVYSLLPDLRNLGGITLMAYVTTVLFQFIFLFCIQVGASNFEPATCFALTLLVYFFLISSVGWLNVMSYDIWWTFRGYAKARTKNRRGYMFKFKVYCLYAFGAPLLITIVLGALNNWSDEQATFIRMQIPREGCFIEGNAKTYYVYLPMLLMLVANWMFYIMTAFNIWRLSRNANMLNTADSSATGGTASARHKQKERLGVYLKLTVLMGLNWILEVVSSFQPDWAIWYITDLYNLLIGVIIFVMFVCKRHVYASLKKRFDQSTLQSHRSSVKTSTQATTSPDSTLLNMPLNHPDDRKR